MARIDNLDNFLTDISTAIKNKLGDETPIAASDFDTNINNIVELKGETKTVKSTTTSQTILPTSGKNGITEITVEALDLETKNVTPTTSSQTITPSQNKDGISQVIVSAVDNTIDQNILAENIRKDIELLGVTGSYGSSNNCKVKSVLTNNYFYRNIISIDLVDISELTSAASMFSGYSSLTTVPLLNTSSVTNMQQMFYNCSSLTTVPLFNTSSVTTIWRMFSGCSSLTTVPQFNTQNVTNMTQVFGGCTSLTTVPQFDTSSATNMSNMFNNCRSLSNESLNNILAMCTNAVGITKTLDKKLSSIGLTSAQATTCQSLSNYQAFLDAGWTTGY